MRRYRTKSAFTSFLRALRDETDKSLDAAVLPNGATGAKPASREACASNRDLKVRAGRKEAPDA